MIGAINRRAVVSGALLLGIGAAARASRLTVSASITPMQLDRLIPEQFGQWRTIPTSAQILPDPDQEKTIAATYEEVVSRSYIAPDGRFVMLVIAHGRADSGLLAIHRADVCYTAQGFTVGREGTATLRPPYDMVRGQKLFAVKDDREEPIIYWATIGGAQSDVGIEQKLRLIKTAWEGRPTDSFLVRVSTIGPATPASFATLTIFLADLLDHVPGSMRPMLAGSGHG
jgi:EpsI family protein